MTISTAKIKHFSYDMQFFLKKESFFFAIRRMVPVSSSAQKSESPLAMANGLSSLRH